MALSTMVKDPDDTYTGEAPGLPARFQELKVLGAGAQGRVVCARDRELKRLVVVKVQTLHAMGKGEEASQRFLSEARILAGLRHPRILPLLDHGLEGGIAYHVFPAETGESLDQVLKARGDRLPVAEVGPLLRDLAEALAYLHEAGLVHRDVKPANVLIVEDGRPVLIDFGLARVLEETQGITKTGVVVGTPAFLSPDALTSGTHAPPSDVYALGVLAFECLSGRRPFVGRSLPELLHKHLHEPPPDVRKLASGVSEALARLVGDMLAKKASSRPSAAEVSARLAEVEAEVGPSPARQRPLLASSRPGPAGPLETPQRSRRSPVGLAVPLVVLFAASVAVGRWTADTPPPSAPRPGEADETPRGIPQDLRDQVSEDMLLLEEGRETWMRDGAFDTFRWGELLALHPGLLGLLRWNRDNVPASRLDEDDHAFLRQLDSDLQALGYPRPFQPFLASPEVSAEAFTAQETKRLAAILPLREGDLPESQAGRQALRLLLGSMDEVIARSRAGVEGAVDSPRLRGAHILGAGRREESPHPELAWVMRMIKHVGGSEQGRAELLTWFSKALRDYRAALALAGRALEEDPASVRAFTVLLLKRPKSVLVLHLASFADLDPSLVLGAVPREPIGFGLQGTLATASQIARKPLYQEKDRDPRGYLRWLRLAEEPVGSPSRLEEERALRVIGLRLEGHRVLDSPTRYQEAVNEVFPRIAAASPEIREVLCGSLALGIHRAERGNELDISRGNDLEVPRDVVQSILDNLGPQAMAEVGMSEAREYLRERLRRDR
jgi:serine/threonine protein kinase